MTPLEITTASNRRKGTDQSTLTGPLVIAVLSLLKRLSCINMVDIIFYEWYLLLLLLLFFTNGTCPFYDFIVNRFTIFIEAHKKLVILTNKYAFQMYRIFLHFPSM